MATRFLGLGHLDRSFGRTSIVNFISAGLLGRARCTASIRDNVYVVARGNGRTPSSGSRYRLTVSVARVDVVCSGVFVGVLDLGRRIEIEISSKEEVETPS